jgi:Cysteine rich repeat
MHKAIVVAFGLALLLSSDSTSAQPTPAQRQACEQDAYKFCQEAIPDEAKVRRCLSRNMRRLSPTCRSAFKGKKKRSR